MHVERQVHSAIPHFMTAICFDKPACYSSPERLSSILLVLVFCFCCVKVYLIIRYAICISVRKQVAQRSDNNCMCIRSSFILKKIKLITSLLQVNLLHSKLISKRRILAKHSLKVLLTKVMSMKDLQSYG